eukprot:g16399.t1
MTKAREVVCVETGATFPSVSAAARHVGRDRTTIAHAISLGTPAAGFTWAYIKPELYVESDKDEIFHVSSVQRCLECDKLKSNGLRRQSQNTPGGWAAVTQAAAALSELKSSRSQVSLKFQSSSHESRAYGLSPNIIESS